MLSIKDEKERKWAKSLIDECIKSYGTNGNYASLHYIPSCLKLLKDLVKRNVSKESIANFLISMKRLSINLFNEFTSRYNVELLLPRNVNPIKDIKVYVWPSILMNRKTSYYSLTFYNWFSFSFKPGDGKSELEPITFLFRKVNNKYELLTAYARVHYDLCEYDLSEKDEVKILFAKYGHTPDIMDINYVRVRCPKFKHNPKKTGRKYWDRIWLSAGSIITRIGGVNKFKLKSSGNHIRISFLGCLPKTTNNPFKSPIYPLEFF